MNENNNQTQKIDWFKLQESMGGVGKTHNHCWHTRGFNSNQYSHYSDEICCHCGHTKQQHGPFAPSHGQYY